MVVPWNSIPIWNGEKCEFSLTAELAAERQLQLQLRVAKALTWKILHPHGGLCIHS
jgi:hypothetical protein